MEVIKICSSAFEASVIKTLLEDHGIRAQILNEHINQVMPHTTALSSMKIRVVVAREDVEKACEIVNRNVASDGPQCPECGCREYRIKSHGIKKIIFVLLAGIIGNYTNTCICQNCGREF